MFHGNSNNATNVWAADMIGKTVQWRRNVGENEGESESTGSSYGESRNESRGLTHGVNDGGGSNQGSTYSGMELGGSSNSGSSSSWGSSQGKSRTLSGGTTTGTNQGRSTTMGKSAGASEVIDYQLQPNAFTTLRSGGDEHGFVVDGIVVKAKRWKHSGSVWLPCEFPQN